MKHTAAHEPPGDFGCLEFGAFRRRMDSEIAGDGDEDMPALVGIAQGPTSPLATCMSVKGRSSQSPR
jgi:hypothetical protein